MKPVKNGYISSTFEAHVLRSPKGSWGIDIGCKDKDPVNVVAATSGVVQKCGWSDTFGNRVWLKMTSGEHKGFYAIYPHLIKIDSKIKEGVILNEGDLIGEMGNTGIIMVKGRLVINKFDGKTWLIPMPEGRHLHYEHRTTMDTTGKSLKPNQIISEFL